jgi:hypothetical protein
MDYKIVEMNLDINTYLQYKSILRENLINDFQNKINELLNEGYIPTGGICISQIVDHPNHGQVQFTQALISPDKINGLQKIFEPIVGSINTVKQEMKLYQEKNNFDEVVEILTTGDKVEFIEIGSTVTVAGKEAPMVSIKTKNGNIGWGFSGFLEKTIN